MIIEINGQQFEKTQDIGPLEGVYYKRSWYKPIPKFKEGDWVTFFSEVAQENHVSKIKEWTGHNWCKLESGAEPFKHLLRKASHNEIWCHLQKIAKEKGLVRGAKVYKFISDDGKLDDGFVTIVQENSDYYAETDEFVKSGIILYRKGKWVEKVEPLFKTEDGKDIYKNDDFYVCKHNKILLDFPHKCNANSSFSNVNWEILFLTKEKAQEYIDKHKPKEWEILSFIAANKYIRYKNNNGLFPSSYDNQNNPENTNNEFTEEELLKGKWYKIHSVRRIKNGEVFTLGDKCISKNNIIFNIDKFELNDLADSKLSAIAKHPICASYNNVCLSSISKCIPKLTFGGHECSFQVYERGTRYDFKTVEITCKNEVGTHWQLESIINYYEKELKFGNQKLNKPISDKVSIGCIHNGTIQELKNIYNHCLNLLGW